MAMAESGRLRGGGGSLSKYVTRVASSSARLLRVGQVGAGAALELRLECLVSHLGHGLATLTTVKLLQEELSVGRCVDSLRG